jgi:RNA ligase (TIGR02306 family)
MSTFAVSVERIAEIWAHPNADRLDMARLSSMSYQFVVAKGMYTVGEPVVYFPIDSVLPDSLAEKLELKGKLAGADKNRVKTVRLRGEISQGVVAKPQHILPDWDESKYHEGEDVAAQLGVTKYDPPPIVSQAGLLVPLPDMVSVYDIEGAERFAAIVEGYLLTQPVTITEKLEGSHFSASLYASGDIAVCQRRFRIEPIESAEHDWHKAARAYGILDALPRLKQKLEQQGLSVQVVTVRGEMIGTGIQGNYYKLPKRQLYLFEIEVNGIPLDVQPYLDLVEEFGLPSVPVLAVNQSLLEWLAGRSLAAASNGKSLINPALMREGIVIRPMVEARDTTFGRVIIKQRSPDYLAVSDY